MMKLKHWADIPKPFRGSLIVSAILVLMVSIIAGMVKNIGFGVETATTGFFSVALLGVYVVCVGGVMADVRSAMTDGPNEAAANAAVSRISYPPSGESHRPAGPVAHRACG